MSQSFRPEKGWLKKITDRLAANLREAGFTKEDATTMVASSADPVEAPEPVLVGLTTPIAQSLIPEGFQGFQAFDPAFDLDRVTQVCKHPGIAIHRFPNGETTHCCQVCAKVWPGLQEGIDDAEQTRPITMTGGDATLESSLSLDSEMSARMGASVAAMVALTSDPVMRDPISYQPGTTMMYYDAASLTINQPQQDPALVGAGQKYWQAKAAAQEALGRRTKAMEDAARAAAAAFDLGVEDEAAPVNLDPDRKLKVVA